MTDQSPFIVPLSFRPIGFVRSPLISRKDAPRQSDEGAPEAWVEIDPAFADAMLGMQAGDDIILLTWLHESRREVLQVYPRGDRRNALTGVFATRSPDRPNPIGLHCVHLLEIKDGLRFRVAALEAIDGTPVIDIKPVLGDPGDR